MKKFWDILIYNGIPVLVVFGFYRFGLSWNLAVIMLLLAVYWYGPVIIYMRQRMPTSPVLSFVDSEDALAPELRQRFDLTIPLLQSLGFIRIGMLASADKKQPIQGAVALLQHQATSDIVNLLAAAKDGGARIAETLAITRFRTDGSRIVTSQHTIPSPFPSNPGDDVLRLYDGVEPSTLWRIHQARVSADARSTRNVTITDAVAYQMDLERKGAQKNIAPGLWQFGESPEFLRPTLRGAFIMSLRLLPPWSQISRMRTRMKARHYLKNAQSEK